MTAAYRDAAVAAHRREKAAAERDEADHNLVVALKASLETPLYGWQCRLNALTVQQVVARLEKLERIEKVIRT